MSKRKIKPVERAKLLFAVQHLQDLGDAINNFVRDGDRVRLNVPRITGRKNYMRLQESYREFVEANADSVFTARAYRPKADGFSAMLEFAEAPTWLFGQDDLIRVEDGAKIE